MQRLLLVSLLAVSAPWAHALSLDFGEQAPPPAYCASTADGLGAAVTCGDFGFIAQSYGDVAGVVDVSYAAPRLAAPQSLQWWDTGYNNLYGVAFAAGGDGDSLARIEIKALLPGAAVTLTGLDLGAFPSTTRNTTLNIYTLGGGTLLYTYSGAVGDGAVAATHFAPNVSAAGGLWIEWQDAAYNVGIDHIDYSVGVVPEPATVWLMLAGALGLVAWRRRS